MVSSAVPVPPPLALAKTTDTLSPDGLLRHAAPLLRARPDLRVDDVLDP